MAEGRIVEYVIDIVELEKSFRRQTLGKRGYTTFKSWLLSRFQPSRRAPTIVTRAIQDLTLRIPRGASVGIIGKNGSGKSTLLKLITGIYKPTSGKIELKGRVAALIELGAGFHPDFTGRENLFLGGVIHGLTEQQIEQRFDEIVAFAELEQVIDDPVRTYSSGMFMRLGFSLAVHTDPDILLVDEVLAVGDASFVSKCKQRIAEMRRAGKTLLLVTHDLSAVEQWCDEALWLNQGKVCERGEPRRVIDAYRNFIEHEEEEDLEAEVSQSDPGVEVNDTESKPQRWGSREIEILKVSLSGQRRSDQLLFHPEDSLNIEIEYRINEPVKTPVFGIGITRTDGVVIHGSNTDIERIELPELGGAASMGVLRYCIDRLALLEGNYSLDVAVHREDGYPYDYRQAILEFAVRWPLKQSGVFVPRHSWSLERVDSSGKKESFELKELSAVSSERQGANHA